MPTLRSHLYLGARAAHRRGRPHRTRAVEVKSGARHLAPAVNRLVPDPRLVAQTQRRALRAGRLARVPCLPTIAPHFNCDKGHGGLLTVQASLLDGGASTVNKPPTYVNTTRGDRAFGHPYSPMWVRTARKG